MVEVPPFPNISYLFRQDGFDLIPNRGNWKVLCPFHVEKTPSCVVNDNGPHAGRYKCYGCGATGYAVTYLMDRHGMTFHQAVDRIKEILNLPPDDIRHPQPLPRQRTTTDHESQGTIATAAPQSALIAHQADCHRLLNDADAITRIAEWRGYTPELVRWAAVHHLIGIRPRHARYSYGILRESFPVTRPPLPHELTHPEDSPLTPTAPVFLGVHIRLGPGTPGNKEHRPSYRFDPTGIGSWPLVIGDPATATILFFIEGQWDALALVQLLGWHRQPTIPATAAIIALRGAQNWRLWLAHQPLRTDAIAILFPDNDTAGSIWLEDPRGGVPLARALTWADETTPRIHRTEALSIPGGEKDLNEALKKGHITEETFRPALLTLVRSLQSGLKKANTPGTTPPTTFYTYCRTHRNRQDLYGDAARHLIADTTRPRGRPGLRTWLRHWLTQQLSEPLSEALVHLYHAWHTRQPLRPLSTFTTAMKKDPAPDS